MVLFSPDKKYDSRIRGNDKKENHMSGINKVILVGRLGKDPEMRHTQNGTSVCQLNVATSENWVKDGQKQERTEWHRIVCWSKLAEICNEYLKKGRQVYVEGRIQTRAWDDKEGNKRYTTEIVASTVQFLGTSGGRSDASSDDLPVDPGAAEGDTQDTAQDDDIPF